MSRKIEKTKQTSPLAKLTKPKAAKVLMRKRLFTLLDDARKRPVIWICAPPGAGKTTLVASYLTNRKLPCLWYQIDEGDGDIASFFHYMAIAAKHAAPRFRKPLPNLTPEYLLGLPTFTRNYFRELYSRINPSVSPLTKGGIKRGVSKSGFVIVLDNYQDAPANSPLHETIQTGLFEIPDGINVIIISRVEPPSAFAGLRANNRMNIIGWNELYLSTEETSGIVQLKLHKRLSKEVIQELHNKTDGWAAGLVLMLERIRIEDIAKVSVHGFKTQAMFDYFASEIFQKLDEASQKILLQTAFLPIMTGRLAGQLTGSHQADVLLSELNRRNYFTIKKPLPDPVYQYHPLFRGFLLAQARQQLTDAQLIETQRKAAEILEGVGQYEDAVVLYRLSEDWASMARAILANAQAMIAQGRSQTLEEWIKQIPQAVIDEAPWLNYWLGACRVPFAPAEARNYFEQAYRLFKAQGDRTGMFLAWRGIVEAAQMELGDLKVLIRWITELELLLEQNPAYPSPELEAHIACAMFNILTLSQMTIAETDPKYQFWEERTESLALNSNDINLQIQAAFVLIVSRLWRGEFVKIESVLFRLQGWLKSGRATPLNQMTGITTEAMYNWLAGMPEQTLEKVQEGMIFARETGVHIWDFMLIEHGLCAAISINDQALIQKFLQDLSNNLEQARPLDVGFYHWCFAWESLRRGDVAIASQHAAKAEAMAGMAIGWMQGLIFAIVADVLAEEGKYAEAKVRLTRLYDVAHHTQSHLLRIMALLIETQLSLKEGSEAQAIDLLSHAFSLAKQQGCFNFFGWRASVMTRLCTLALEQNIEVEYVQTLIKKRGLIPPEGFISELWPWQIKIYTIGRFGLLIDGKPLQSSKKAQKKPLEMLKAIISLGGREVKEGEITDLLWPDAEGDAGHKSFEVTLIRLRRLIGNDKAIRLQDGLVTLDSRYCFVDVWNFERLIGKADALWKENKQTEAIQLYEKAINIYKGSFLKEDRQPYMLSLRERLNGKFTRLISRTGRYYEDAGDIKRAAELYQKGIEVNNLCEEIYQSLMLCYQRLGLKAEAIAAYHQCHNAMTAMLNTEPSAKTKEIYRQIMEKEKT